LQKLNSFGETGKVNVKDPKSSFLPSINMSYNFTKKMLVRIAYGITNNKPEFREIAPFAFYDFNNGYVFKGNPDLTYCTIHNADVKWEFYPNVGEIINVGFFYKRFKNPIEVVNVIGGDRTFSFQNAKKADTYGVEIEVKKNFRRSGIKFFNDLGININAAYIYSKVTLNDKNKIGQSDNRPLQGQAPYTVNVGIFYNNKEKGLQWNILYNVTGKRIVFVGFEDYPDVYEMPKHTIDLNASYNFKKGVELTLGATDLLNQKTTWIQDGNGDKKLDVKKDQVMKSYKTGTAISLGVKYTFK
jgi:TonB-dependent receptor